MQKATKKIIENAIYLLKSLEIEKKFPYRRYFEIEGLNYQKIYDYFDKLPLIEIRNIVICMLLGRASLLDGTIIPKEKIYQDIKFKLFSKELLINVLLEKIRLSEYLEKGLELCDED